MHVRSSGGNGRATYSKDESIVGKVNRLNTTKIVRLYSLHVVCPKVYYVALVTSHSGLDKNPKKCHI